jgi:NhaA family Na+:H+ antiporter
MVSVRQTEKISGFALIFAALFALILDNSPLAWLYDSLLTTPFIIQIGDYGLNKPLLLWINDGLMAVFFFLVGLEIKKEILGGELSSMKKASLPLIAALGGILIPASLYIGINHSNALAMQGWAVPVATDIAFALGILALAGRALPKELKILLLSLAIIDDIAAIVIIALFYTDSLSFMALALASTGFVGALALNRAGVIRIAPYVLIGFFMWVCVLKSGVHATLAGVLMALCVPMVGENKNDCPVKRLEKALHPWVYFMIMPVFAFANAGIHLDGFNLNMLTASIPFGIILGLFAGKQLGVFSFIFLAIKSGLCDKPKSVSWLQIYGLSVLTGIGFTMSLFIGTLAFDDYETMAQVRLGVLVASFLSALTGFLVLRFSIHKK